MITFITLSDTNSHKLWFYAICHVILSIIYFIMKYSNKIELISQKNWNYWIKHCLGPIDGLACWENLTYIQIKAADHIKYKICFKYHLSTFFDSGTQIIHNH